MSPAKYQNFQGNISSIDYFSLFELTSEKLPADIVGTIELFSYVILLWEWETNFLMPPYERECDPKSSPQLVIVN